MTITLEMLAEVIVNQATDACLHRNCAAEARRAGSHWKHLRCRACPLDAVDRLVDAGWKEVAP